MCAHARVLARARALARTGHKWQHWVVLSSMTYIDSPSDFNDYNSMRWIRKFPNGTHFTETLDTHAPIFGTTYQTAQLGNRTLRWLADDAVPKATAAHDAQPFFAYIGPHAPHFPAEPAPWYQCTPLALSASCQTVVAAIKSSTIPAPQPSPRLCFPAGGRVGAPGHARLGGPIIKQKREPRACPGENEYSRLAAPRTPNYNYSDARKPRHVAQNPPLTATAKCWEVWPACRAR